MSPTQTSRTTETVLALAATIASSSVAYGEAVRFDNDGSFSFAGLLLDITKPANEQVDFSQASDHAIQLGVNVDKYFNAYSLYDRNRTSETGSVEFWTGPGLSLDFEALGAGAQIGTNLTDGRWLFIADFATYYAPSYYYGPGGLSSTLPIGEPTYLGVRIDLADGAGFRYGWLGVELVTDNPYGYRAELDVFAWGYETEAGVGIAAGVPAPTSLAALAMGAVAFGSRKRRQP